MLSIIAILAWRLTIVTRNAPIISASDISVSELVSATSVTGADVKDLFHKRGCVNCHDSQNTLLGPSFFDIADRYMTDAEAKNILLTSIRKGSQGKWGSMHSMPIHTKASLSDAEADAMIRWMLEPKSRQ